ncbi:MAG: Yip1 family protein [Lysinibacillus sp.]
MEVFPIDNLNSPASKHPLNDEQHQTPPSNEGKLNPLLSVWLHPNQTAQYVMKHKGIGYCIMLIIIGYIAVFLSSIAGTDLYPTFTVGIITIFVVVLGPIIGLISSTIYTGVIFLVGKLFNGQGSYKNLFKVLTLPTIPYLALAPFYAIWLAVSPESMFIADFSGAMVLLSMLSGFLTFIVSVWSIVISIAVIAQAHKFSNWKAFFTILIPMLILFLVLVVFFVLVISIITL